MRRPAFAILAALLLAGCGDDNTATAPSTTSGTMSETWSSVVAPGGQSTRSFTVNSSGTINVTLTAAGATLGLGIGLPRTTGGGCRLGASINTAAGSTPQLTTSADAGQYCVQVYDLGTLSDPVGFALKIDHP
jgi:outer membrane lipoprotein SlyB